VRGAEKWRREVEWGDGRGGHNEASGRVGRLGGGRGEGGCGSKGQEERG